MRILFRYILTELLAPFFLTLLVLTFIMMLTKLLNIADLLFDHTVPWETVVSILSSMTLYLIGFTLPLAFLVSILICFGRLSRDSEILALRTSGIHLYEIAFPVLAISILLFIFSYHMHVRVLPEANWRSALQIQKLSQTGPATFLQEKVWMDGFGKSSLYLKSINADNTFRGVSIHQALDGYKLPRVIRAEQGTYVYDSETSSIRFDLLNGYIEEPKTVHEHDYVPITFKEYSISLPVTFKGHRTLQKKVYHMTTQELDAHLQKSTPGQIDYRTVLHEKYSRVSMSFAIFVFLLMGFPLSIHLQNTEKTANIVIGTGLALAWYLLILLGKRLSIGTGFSVLLATWLANILMGSLGIYLSRRMLKT